MNESVKAVSRSATSVKGNAESLDTERERLRVSVEDFLASVAA